VTTRLESAREGAKGIAFCFRGIHTCFSAAFRILFDNGARIDRRCPCGLLAEQAALAWAVLAGCVKCNSGALFCWSLVWQSIWVALVARRPASSPDRPLACGFGLVLRARATVRQAQREPIISCWEVALVRRLITVLLVNVSVGVQGGTLGVQVSVTVNELSFPLGLPGRRNDLREVWADLHAILARGCWVWLGIFCWNGIHADSEDGDDEG